MVLGFTSVVGDLWHAGHVAMIQECRRHCDKLIVAVMSNIDHRENKNTPIQSLFERTFQVANTKGVDLVLSCDSEADLLLALQTIRPNVRFVGEDYKDKDFTGKSYCEESGIEIFYNHRDHGLSSRTLRERVEHGK